MRIILANSAHSLLLPVFHLGISFTVIRRASPELWGAFVPVLIVMNLAAHLMAWGNKEYLLRAFSRQPHRIAQHWQTHLKTRLLLLLIFSPGVFIWSGTLFSGLWLMLWAVAALMYQSCEVLTLYYRKFLPALRWEAAALGILIGGLVILPEGLTLSHLIAAFALFMALKAGGMLMLFRREVLRPAGASPDLQIFSRGFPFFILGFTGLLQSRTDLYCAAYFLPPEELARYQVLTNLLLYIQGGANLILLPFVKNIYRLGENPRRKLRRSLALTGMALGLPGVGMLYLVLSRGYQFHFPPVIYGLSYLFVVPIFLYILDIYELFGADRQGAVVKVALLATLINLGGSLWLIPRLGLLGALLSATAVQWVVLLIYRGLMYFSPDASSPTHPPGTQFLEKTIDP
ncbi:MAG: hypothetical protein D6681_04185 [Calditrichaeota bacterium]|nr:MAG: hypothetical protein D6681_04185 [Calditrichota bacterium]